MIARKSNMLRSGMIMLFAIALHNIPEGLALGAAGHYDASLGLALALIIGLHNIPEGMAVSAPLIAGGLSKTKSVVITLIAGSTTVIGAVVGVLIGGISDFAVAISFSIAGGAMLYVVLGEILPQSIVTSKDRIPTIFALVGIVVGVLFIEIVG
jgi:ZIP family zinc transporter